MYLKKMTYTHIYFSSTATQQPPYAYQTKIGPVLQKIKCFFGYSKSTVNYLKNNELIAGSTKESLNFRCLNTDGMC